jgi:hypothetical protein
MDLIRLDSSLTPENEYPDDHRQVADRVEKIESHFPENSKLRVDFKRFGRGAQRLHVLAPVRSIIVIGWACVSMGLLLAIAEIYARNRRSIGEAHFTDAMVAGLAQVGALIPGVSRSASTLAAARSAAARLMTWVQMQAAHNLRQLQRSPKTLSCRTR